MRKGIRDMKEFVIQYWMEFIFGTAISMLSYAIKKLNRKLNEQESIKLSIQAILRDRIIDSYNLYQDKGYCPIYARENIEELSTQYFNLGGNGVVHDLLDKLKDLPTDRDNVKGFDKNGK